MTLRSLTCAILILLALPSLVAAESNGQLACGSTSTCASVAGEEIAQRWRDMSAHPLVAHVYRATDRANAVGDQKAPRLTNLATSNHGLTRVLLAGKPAIVLWGELHDNPEHHWARSLLARRQVAGLPAEAKDHNKTVAWVFEQFDQTQQAAIDRFLAANKDDAQKPDLAAFKSAIAFDKSGWQHYNYDSLLQTALDARLPILAGNVAKAEVRSAARQGASSVSDETRKRLSLDIAQASNLTEASIAEIDAAHCGMMPKSAYAGMAFAQRYRDAHLADVALNALTHHAAVDLFAGNAHVRSDRGVPWYLRQRGYGDQLLSIMFVEVEDGKTDPEAYVPRDPDGQSAADFLVFTPTVARGDPCDAFKSKTAK